MQKIFLKKRKSSFQEKVCSVVKGIPRGEVISYRKAASLSGHPRSWRAVGNVLNMSFNFGSIPCHRVIKSDGSVGGYKNGTKKKIALLKKEGIIIKNGKITQRLRRQGVLV